ncbi:MAG: molybdenum cofactor biosynthesis protein F [Azonexaceae bacterium]|nr:molybdenum cofactor biosynthesis protein F [Azonexaceae bacterium]
MTAPEWIPVGALGDAFLPENNCLPPVADLAGRTFNLHFENGWVIEHAFADSERLTWRMTEGEGESRQGEERYVATRPRDDIYFVDFIKSGERATSVSLVLDLKRRTFIAVIGQLPTAEESMTPFITRIAQGKELTAVNATFLRGSIDIPLTPDLPVPEVTHDLLGKRVEYIYSPFEKYEHIYLNDHYYAWRCLAGSEKGLADTDACHYYKIADNLYLFVWREKIVPTLGIVMVDFDVLKTTGKIVGYENNDFGKLRNFTVGARARLLSVIPAE